MDIDRFEKILYSAAKEMSLAFTPHETALYKQFFGELCEWNAKMNITAIKKTEDIIIKHLLDSVVVVRYVDFFGRIVDIGSGGGFPGIPLLIKNPSLQLTLVETNRKKANFMRHITRVLKLKNARVLNGRAEEIVEGDAFDFAVSRAFADIETFVPIAEPLVKKGGVIVCMKGSSALNEDQRRTAEAHGVTFLNEYRFALPREKGERHIVVFQKCFT